MSYLQSTGITVIKKAVAPERGSHCTLRADLCVFPRMWVHGVQFLLVPSRSAYALDCPPTKKETFEAFPCRSEGFGESLALRLPTGPFFCKTS